VIIITFFLVHLAPGNPVDYLVGQAGALDPEHYLEYKNRIETKFGLDRPLHEQLFIYISTVLRGDLGYSIICWRPVSAMILERALNTILLMVSALTFAFVGGIILGVISSQKPYSLRDNITTLFSMFGFSVPVAWLGQMLILIFAIYLGWLPTGGIQTFANVSGFGFLVDRLSHLLLPAFCFGTIYLAIVARLTRANMLEQSRENYVVTARAKGLSERVILFKHMLKNSILPVITVLGMRVGTMIGGTVVTEVVFSWPGLGRLMVESVLKRDYTVLMGMFIFISISVIIASLVTDIISSSIDPRIRYD
jgi:peptide/nickel transport system permease protein